MIFPGEPHGNSDDENELEIRQEEWKSATFDKPSSNQPESFETFGNHLSSSDPLAATRNSPNANCQSRVNQRERRVQQAQRRIRMRQGMNNSNAHNSSNRSEVIDLTQIDDEGKVEAAEEQANDNQNLNSAITLKERRQLRSFLPTFDPIVAMENLRQFKINQQSESSTVISDENLRRFLSQQRRMIASNEANQGPWNHANSAVQPRIGLQSMILPGEPLCSADEMEIRQEEQRNATPDEPSSNHARPESAETFMNHLSSTKRDPLAASGNSSNANCQSRGDQRESRRQQDQRRIRMRQRTNAHNSSNPSEKIDLTNSDEEGQNEAIEEQASDNQSLNSTIILEERRQLSPTFDPIVAMENLRQFQRNQQRESTSVILEERRKRSLENLRRSVLKQRRMLASNAVHQGSRNHPNSAAQIQNSLQSALVRRQPAASSSSRQESSTARQSNSLVQSSNQKPAVDQNASSNPNAQNNPYGQQSTLVLTLPGVFPADADVDAFTTRNGFTVSISLPESDLFPNCSLSHTDSQNDVVQIDVEGSESHGNEHNHSVGQFESTHRGSGSEVFYVSSEDEEGEFWETLNTSERSLNSSTSPSASGSSGTPAEARLQDSKRSDEDSVGNVEACMRDAAPPLRKQRSRKPEVSGSSKKPRRE